MPHSNFDNRHYVIVSSGDAASVDFSQVMETSIDTIRYSLDGTQTFIKYDYSMPPSVSGCSSRSSEYGHTEILNVLSGVIWTATGVII